MPYERRFRGFHDHPKLEGTHAVLSPSSYHWLNYPDEKLLQRLKTLRAAAKGTSLHALAAHAISEGVKLDVKGLYPSLAAYVNDAIDMGLVPEQTLFYSINCYGTADTIGFTEYPPDQSNYVGFLRIHDFKSGVAPTNVKQLYIYAAIFCLEYGILPYEIEGELCIYQGDDIRAWEIDRNELAQTYDKIISSDRIVEAERRED